MKKIATFCLTLFLLMGTLVSFSTDGVKEVKLKTSAICNMCKARLERNVGLSKGVKEVALDVNSKVLTVKYNSAKTDVAEIKKTVSKIGYDADEVVAIQSAHDKLPKCCRKGAVAHKD